MPVSAPTNTSASSPPPAAAETPARTVVSTTPLFATIADELLRTVAEAGHAVFVEAGAIVFRQGEPGDTLYCVLSGTVRLCRALEDGSEIELRRAGPGDSFGELALLDGGARDATAETVAACQLFVLRRTDFLAAIPRAPTLLSTVLANLVQVVRTTTEDLLRHELAQRVARTEMEFEKYRALAQMVAGVAHEVNTPIGIVNTAASIIRQRLSSEAIGAAVRDAAAVAAFSDIQEASELIDANIRRAHKLIRDFKQLSVSHVADTLETLTLVDVVDEVVSLFKISARQAKLTIHVCNSLPDSASFTWIGYRGLLSQVLLNLLTNVERYAYAQGTGGPVEIVLGQTGDGRNDRFTIIVRDSGCGMTPDTRDKIFEPFYTTGRSKGATGLGMAIVHNLMTSALAGTVEVTSREGAGTAVTLTFPKSVPARAD